MTSQGIQPGIEFDGSTGSFKLTHLEALDKAKHSANIYGNVRKAGRFDTPEDQLKIQSIDSEFGGVMKGPVTDGIQAGSFSFDEVQRCAPLR